MENICNVVTPRVASEHITKVTIPSGGLNPGSVVLASAIDSSIPGNYEVFTATQPLTATLNNDALALIVNDGYETLADGRRPGGQPDYYQYNFKEGEVATAIYLDKHLIFEISNDAVTVASGVTPAVNQYLFPTNAASKLTLSDTLPEGQTKYLKILAIRNNPIGGMFGGQFATSYICRVE